METVRYSLIVFYDEEAKILLQDRKEKSKRGNEWGFRGGHIEKGETVENALIRETKEELDYDLQDGEYEFLYQLDWEIPEENLLIDRTIFVAPLEDKMQKFKVLEGGGMKLFSIAEAKKLKMFEGDYPILDALEKFLEDKQQRK